ncbi:MAG: hypothetical protein ACFCBW_18175 [Candidatus Competibacterales bacterium]
MGHVEQGSLIILRGDHALEGISRDGEQLLVVIRHDCDLSRDAHVEPYVEIIVGKRIDKPRGSHIRAKHVREIDLTYQQSGTPYHITLSRLGIKLIKKQEWCHKLDTMQTISPSFADKRALKQWLAIRYGRPAFPDRFENYLRKKKGKKNVEQHMARVLGDDSENIVGVFFDLGEARYHHLAEEEPYVLAISIAYDEREGGSQARARAEKASSDIAKLFHEIFGPPETATEIALESCEAVADTEMSLADLRRIDQWRIEYISLADDDDRSLLPTADHP